MNSPLAKRFWSKVKLAPGDQCWEWQAGFFKDHRPPHARYGAFSYKGRNHGSHRIAWLLATGQWPTVVRHTICDNPRCCRPSHLTNGTHADNVLERQMKGRSHRKLTINQVNEIRACPRGTGQISKLAAKFGVSAAHACRVRKGSKCAGVTSEGI